MIDATEHGRALRGIAGRLCRMPDHLVRDPIGLVDWHRDMANALRGLADQADPPVPAARLAKPLPPRGPSEVVDRHGRPVRVERRGSRG